ncbi:MAG: DNA-directed RNA polymerase subunit delta [Atopostipes suicloacalis]|nr:DNA-directed RNA polymerase subunit delta [Atopostipes suicloacalis]MDN6731035.1 DNA-directed RNA polymerase subunit delta [Atopostipes suicloacalis]
MKLKQFEGERLSELSMIRVAKAVLEEKGEVMDFQDILTLVSDFIGLTKAEKEKRMAQFYTDMNVDGEFISLGDNTWGLRTWYPVDSINEVLTHENDEADVIPHISPDGFDEYQDAALEAEFKEELEEENIVAVDSEDPDDLDEYKENLEEIGADDIDEADLSDLDDVVDEEDLLDEDLIDEDDEDE